MIDKFDREKVAQLEKAMNYNYKNIKLLEEALSHPSLKQQSKYGELQLNYERLELLGDAILGLIITEVLFDKFTYYDEGEIAKIKAYLVCRDTLVKVGNKINLGYYIIMTKGEESSGGRENPGNIENVMEAIIASIYLDGGMENARKLVENLWANMLSNVNFSEVDPKTYLQEWSQSNKHGIPLYEVTEKIGPVHSPIFTVKVTVGPYQHSGTGGSIKLAEKDAARALLAIVKK
jgi:ribonuclease III